MADRAQLYITFGLQYGNLDEADEAIKAGRTWKDPHPIVPWASGRGYLTVDYAVDDDALESTTPARERARQAAWTWLEGNYAFDYDEPPSAEHAPLGELARMTLP
jgi:hypothetical protein